MDVLQPVLSNWEKILSLSLPQHVETGRRCRKSITCAQNGQSFILRPFPRKSPLVRVTFPNMESLPGSPGVLMIGVGQFLTAAALRVGRGCQVGGDCREATARLPGRLPAVTAAASCCHSDTRSSCTCAVLLQPLLLGGFLDAGRQTVATLQAEDVLTKYE